jgi:hypothetical protein
MIKWLRKKLGIDTIDKNIVESNSTTKNQLLEINKSIENLKPKKETEIIEVADIHQWIEMKCIKKSLSKRRILRSIVNNINCLIQIYGNKQG